MFTINAISCNAAFFLFSFNNIASIELLDAVVKNLIEGIAIRVSSSLSFTSAFTNAKRDPKTATREFEDPYPPQAVSC